MEQTQKIHTPLSTQTHESDKNQPLILEYPDLVDAVQLSVARQIGVPGTLEVHSFQKALVTLTEEEKADVLCEVGQQFDEALITFVISAVIAKRQRPVIIVADETEGINGYLPWQGPLEKRISEAEVNQTLTGADIRVERVRKIADTMQEFGKYACGQTMTLAHP